MWMTAKPTTRTETHPVAKGAAQEVVVATRIRKAAANSAKQRPDEGQHPAQRQAGASCQASGKACATIGAGLEDAGPDDHARTHSATPWRTSRWRWGVAGGVVISERSRVRHATQRLPPARTALSRDEFTPARGVGDEASSPRA